MLSISSSVVAVAVGPDTTMPVVAVAVRVWCARERSVSSRVQNMRLKLALEAPVVRILEQIFPGQTERHLYSPQSSPPAAKAGTAVVPTTALRVQVVPHKVEQLPRHGAEVAVVVAEAAVVAAVRLGMAYPAQVRRVGLAERGRQLRSPVRVGRLALVELAQMQASITEAHQVRPIPVTEVVVAGPQVLHRGAEGMVARELSSFVIGCLPRNCRTPHRCSRVCHSTISRR